MAFFQGLLNYDADAFFEKLRDVRVSSHLIIGRGGAVYQSVAFDKRAWHAGESVFQERARCNDFSIGIELVGDEEGPFTDEQHHSLSSICDRLCATYEIPGEHIVGHRDIAPGRKVDPGADFDYAKIRPSSK